jgi:hypothetical protein
MQMQTFLEEFFKNTPLGINSVMKAAVALAEQVNSKEISGKEKTELVVSSLLTFLGEGNPELVALVQGVVPGMLHLVVSTARGEFKLSAVRNCSCFPAVAAAAASAATASATASASAATASALSTSAATQPASTAERWAWLWSKPASNPAVTVRTPQN